MKNKIDKFINSTPYYGHCTEEYKEGLKDGIKWALKNKSTEIKDKNGNEIFFGDKLRFSDKIEWYYRQYSVDVLLGKITKEDAIKEIEKKPYEERTIESVQDYEWLLSNEIQIYWEVVTEISNS